MYKSEIKILHLSDLHIKKATLEQDEKFNSLVEIIFVQHNIKPFDYIFITGDIIDCGNVNSYKQAYQYLTYLFDKLNFNKKNVFIVPGNHDNNLKINEKIEDAIRKDLTNATFDEIQKLELKNKSILDKLKDRQKEFFKFLNTLNINSKIPHHILDEDRHIVCINSSIFSDIHDYRNQIYFVNYQFKEIKKILSSKNEKIFILTHHPIDYYEENTKDDVLNFARKHNAFIFSGHSHIQAYEKQFRNNQVAHQFWCGNFQDNKNASFNIVEIDYDLDAFKLSIGYYSENKWIVKSDFSDKIKDFRSDILFFLMDIKHKPKIEQFKLLWYKLFDSPKLKFEDFWEDSSLLICKFSNTKLRNKIKKHIYSMSECCLLYLLFQKIDNFQATKIFRDIPINLNKLDWYEENRYKRELLNTAAILIPDLFKFP